MTRATLIADLHHAVLRRVRKCDRRDVRAQLVAIDEAWSAIVETSIRSAYANGQQETEAQHAANEKSGFEMGYAHGLERAIGQVGAPARRVDEDDMTAPVS